MRRNRFARRAHAPHSSSSWALGSCLRIYLPAGRRVYPRTVPDSKTPAPWHGCTLRRVRSGAQADGKGRWSSRCGMHAQEAPHHIQRRALSGRTTQMRPLFITPGRQAARAVFFILGGDEEAVGVAEADARDAALLLNDLAAGRPSSGKGSLGRWSCGRDALGAPAAALAGVDHEQRVRLVQAVLPRQIAGQHHDAGPGVFCSLHLFVGAVLTALALAI